MRITFVLEGIGICGGVRVVFEHANRLKARGHEVSIAYPAIPSMYGRKGSCIRNVQLQVMGLAGNLLRMNRVHWFNLDAKLIMLPAISPSFVQLFAGQIPDGDIIVATAWVTAHAVNALDRRKGEKFYFVQGYEIWDVWDEEACWNEAERLDGDTTRLGITMSQIQASKFGLERSKSVVDESYKLPLIKLTVTTWLKKLIEDQFGGQVEAVVPNGVNIEEFYNEHKKYNDRKRILMLYSKSRLKGVDDGINAFEMAREQHPNIQLVMFGLNRGSNIPDYVEFHERPHGEDLRRLYCSCDIFLWPSWIEGFGLPPMEAMCCKCALVATSVGAVPDYTISGETALISPPRRPELMARNISKLLNNELLLKSISEAGYEHIKKFNWQNATDLLEQVFLKALNKSRT